MKLLRVKYEKHIPHQYYLLLFLGNRDNRIIGLKSEGVPESEALIIRTNDQLLETANLDFREKWIKQNTPTAYKNYISLDEKFVKVLKEHSIKPIGIKEKS